MLLQFVQDKHTSMCFHVALQEYNQIPLNLGISEFIGTSFEIATRKFIFNGL